MTSTAFDDQYTTAPEPVRQPYDTVAILRRNIADMEVALKQQTERAENAEEKLTTAREDMQSWIDSRNGWMERAGAAEAELARLREQKQKPVGWVDADGDFYHGRHYPNVWPTAVPVYAAPVPAPAVPELDPMTRLIVSDPKQLKPKKQEPAVPSVVFMAHNKTSSILFAARKDADQYAASFGPAAGVSVTECAVIGSQSAPQAPAVPEQRPIWSGWSVWFKGGDGLFPAHFLHDSYGIPLRYPTRFAAAEKIKRHTRDSRELYEPREYSLYDAPQAPAVPSGCVAYLAQLADDPCQCHCCRTKRRKASALLQSAEVKK